MLAGLGGRYLIVPQLAWDNLPRREAMIVGVHYIAINAHNFDRMLTSTGMRSGSNLVGKTSTGKTSR